MKRRLKLHFVCALRACAGAGLPEEAALFAGVPSPRCVTRVEMAPKKGKGKKGGDDAGGKVKDPAPTEVEREELRLKIELDMLAEEYVEEHAEGSDSRGTGLGWIPVWESLEVIDLGSGKPPQPLRASEAQQRSEDSEVSSKVTNPMHADDANDAED